VRRALLIISKIFAWFWLVGWFCIFCWFAYEIVKIKIGQDPPNWESFLDGLLVGVSVFGVLLAFSVISAVCVIIIKKK